jgi:hypothetical protein
MGFAVTTYSDPAALHNPVAVGILSSRISSLDQTLNLPESVTQTQVSLDRYNLFKDPSKKIDGNCLNIFVDPINLKKSQIEEKGDFGVFVGAPQYHSSESAAFSALETVYGSHTATSGVYSSRQAVVRLTFTGGTDADGNPTPPALSSQSAGSVVSFQNPATDGNASGVLLDSFNAVAGVTTHALVRDVSGVFAAGVGNTISIVGAAFTTSSAIQYVGMASVFDDIMVFTQFPHLEPTININQDNPFDGRKTVLLTNSNEGIGFANTFFANGLSTSKSSPTPTLDQFVVIEGSASGKISFTGDVFAFDTSANTESATSITNLRNEIVTLRVGTGSNNNIGVTSFQNAADAVKQQKKGHAINYWSGKRMDLIAQQDKNTFETAIEILTNPAYQ